MSGSFGFNASGIGSAFSDLGGAVSDLFASEGESAEASAYGTAAQLANENATLALESSKIQQYQQTRSAELQMGSEQAAMAGNNLTGGSGALLLKSSGQQAALGTALTSLQGEITSTGFQQQAAALQGEQQAAEKASTAAGIGGILSVGAGIAALF